MGLERFAVPLRYFLPATLVAGSLDLLFAFAWAYARSDVPPAVVLKVIASGLAGPEAIGGDWRVALGGAALHFGIMAGFAGVAWWMVSHRVFGSTPWPAVGCAYGTALFLLMNYVVVPLSLAPLPLRTTAASIIPELAAHVLLVGMPLVWLAGRSLPRH